jgi:hypothetical protein
MTENENMTVSSDPTGQMRALDSRDPQKDLGWYAAH